MVFGLVETFPSPTWLPEASPGFIQPAAYTTGGKALSEKNKITNTRLGMKVNINLEYEIISNLEKLLNYHQIHNNIIFVLTAWHTSVILFALIFGCWVL